MTETIKLSEWGRRNAMSYQTALKHYQRGLIPGARKTGTGRIVIDLQPSSSTERTAALYARVSTRGQASGLEHQLSACRAFAAGQGIAVSQEVTEIGSGMNDRRPKLAALLKDDSWTVLVVEHPDRLARFGRSWIEELCSQTGREVRYLNTATDGDNESLVQDLTDVVASFCGRLYGARGGSRRAAQVGEILAEDPSR